VACADNKVVNVDARSTNIGKDQFNKNVNGLINNGVILLVDDLSSVKDLTDLSTVHDKVPIFYFNLKF
jgi:hypothetical protein